MKIARWISDCPTDKLRSLPVPFCSSPGVPSEKEQPTRLEHASLSLQHSPFQVLPFLACSRWQKDCSPAQTTPIPRIKEKMEHKNSYTNQKWSRQYCHKHLIQTAQPSPFCWLVQLSRKCGHWHCQPAAQVNQGPLLTCISWPAVCVWFLSPYSTC